MSIESAASRTTIEVPPREGLNLALAALHVTAATYALFLLPLLLLPRGDAWLLTLLPLVALNNPLWSLIHETIHGSLHRSMPVNHFFGRLLAGYCYGAPWRIVRTGHLLHHRFNRTPMNRLEAFDPARRSGLFASIHYFYRLFLGLFVQQVLAPIAFYMPGSVMRDLRAKVLDEASYSAHASGILMRPQNIKEIRVDATLLYLCYGLAMLAYGAYWWVVPCILLARGFCISFLDYIYHYDTSLDDVEYALNLDLPRPVATALLNFNLHGVHHRFPNLPWHALPQVFAEERTRYDDDYLAATLAQLRGPIPLSRLEHVKASA